MARKVCSSSSYTTWVMMTSIESFLENTSHLNIKLYPEHGHQTYKYTIARSTYSHPPPHWKFCKYLNVSHLEIGCQWNIGGTFRYVSSSLLQIVCGAVVPAIRCSVCTLKRERLIQQIKLQTYPRIGYGILVSLVLIFRWCRCRFSVSLVLVLIRCTYIFTSIAQALCIIYVYIRLYYIIAQ